MTDVPSHSHHEHRVRQRLIKAAAAHLTRNDYDETLLEQAALAAGYSLDQAMTFFQSSEDIVVALYHGFASDLESRLVDLPKSTLSERFKGLMRIKFEITEPYRKTLSGLIPNLSDRKDPLGVLSAETEAIRARVKAVIAETIDGSTDRHPASTELLSENLYAAYLFLMWLWFKDANRRHNRVDRVLNAVCRTLSFTAPRLSKPRFRVPLSLLGAIPTSLLYRSNPTADEKAKEILRVIFRHRRLQSNAGDCREEPCSRCLALHLPRASYFVAAERPVHLILPAFPAKSPNRRKTLGPMPDMAEEQALLFLAGLCAKVRAIYPPGLRLTICSDGHVFSDLVGVSDPDVTSYGAALSEMIERLGLENYIDTFSLRDMYEDIGLDGMREKVNLQYEPSLASLRERATKIPQVGTLVNGIHRFLFEDNLEADSTRTRSQVRNHCRELAYQVVQRSDGWGRLLSDCFPMALRLSIHPQEPHSSKIGILLGESDDVWLTPWHAVALKENGTFKLIKRREAELRGASLAAEGGYYEI